MEQVKTGTTTIAVKYDGGVLIAADKRVTVGHMIADGDFKKVHQLTNNIAVTIAGMAADAILHTRYLKSEIRLNQLRINREMSVKEVAELLSSFQYGALRTQGSVVHYIVAGHDDTGAHIFDVFPDGSITEKPKFMTSGSGSTFVMGVLDNGFADNLSQPDAARLVKQGFRAAMRNDSASGNGADIFKIDGNGVALLESVKVEAGISVE